MGRVVGIDLGTSTSEIAFINSENKPELILNREGKGITPSIVYIDENHHAIVGEKAKEMAVLEPENTVIEVKRLMGSDTFLTIREKEYSPSQISAFILSYLKECAQQQLGETIERAVITVPAYFTDAQRKATIEAGQLAGLTVERIINEPTAASLDYGILHMQACKNVLVYDFGGGTLDVTALELFEGVIDVKSTCGNNKLGGLDFDNAIIRFLSEKCEKDYHIHPKEDKRAFMRLKNAAETCKIALSKDESFAIELPFLLEKAGQPIGLNETMERTRFEALIEPLVESTMEPLQTALREAKLSMQDIDLLILVGGSTKIPLVSKIIEQEIGVSPKSLLDPDLAVVRGAAIQAGIIEGIFGEDGIVIVDICPHTLSVAALRDGMWGEELFCKAIIHKNTTIPVKKEDIFYTSCDRQTEVEVHVYQGEGTYPEDNILLGEFMLTGIPPRKAQKEKIAVEFAYDLNGILVSKAKVISNDASAEIVIDMNRVDTEERKQAYVERGNWEEAKAAKKYRAVIKKAEKLLAQCDDRELHEALIVLKEGLVDEEPTDYLDILKDDLLEIIYDLDESHA